jgi:hypothetical protein
MRASLIPPGIEATQASCAASPRRWDCGGGIQGRLQSRYYFSPPGPRCPGHRTRRCSYCCPVFDAPSPSRPEASLLVAARFGSWRGGQRELEDIDVLRTHFSMESKNRDSGRTDPNCGNASLLRARNAGCLDDLFRPVCLSGRDRPYLVSYLVPSGPCPPAAIGMDGEAWEGLRSRSLTPFAYSLTGLSGSRKHDSRPRLLCPGHEELGLERHWHSLADSSWRPHA